MRRAFGLAAIVVGLVLLAFAASFVFDTSVDGDPIAIERSLQAEPSPTYQTPPISTDSTLQEDPQPLWQQAITGDPEGKQQAPVPTALRIGAIDVDAPISPYGVNPDSGQMEVPRNVEEVAWYKHGPTPGTAGSAVLAAHVDLQSQGPGVFYELSQLQSGDIVVVEYSDNSTRRFVVQARTKYLKEDLPLAAIFSRTGPSVLTLITCGGGFSGSDNSYDSNIVVYAVPEGQSQEIDPNRDNS